MLSAPGRGERRLPDARRGRRRRSGSTRQLGARRQRPHRLDARRRHAQPARSRRAPRVRTSCSTPRRSSAGSASGSATSRRARAAGTSTCSTSGASTPPKARRNYREAIKRIHPEDRAAMVYADSTRRAGRYSQRYRVVHPDGKTRWIHSQWEVKNGPRGVPDRAIGVMMDDTETYEAARALSEVNAQLKLAADLGKIASWRHDLRTGRMHFSDVTFELLGMAPRPRRRVDRRGAVVHPSRRPSARQGIGRAGAGDEPAGRHGGALPARRRQLALPAVAPRRRAQRRPARRSRSSASRST